MTSESIWKHLRALPSKITNKYLIALLAFGVWMTFFDKNNFIAQMEYSRRINDLREQKAFFEDGMLRLKDAHREMMNNPEMYAREHHYMHTEGEHVFVVHKSSQN